MARPRIFISSTFYDLRQVRDDLERSIRELGYEPVRHEAGSVPYSKGEGLEAAAYREVELCDVIVAVVGGRFGTESEEEPGHSISHVELRRALERGIQIFVFVDKNVLGEHSTYKLNKGNKTIKYSAVNDARVFEFLDELYALSRNNPIAPFEVASDITSYLKAQFAGLFQRFLQEQKRLTEMRVLEEMNSVAKTLKDVVGFLTEERKSDEAVKNILVANHPAFRRLAKLTKAPYRVFFSTRDEMEKWLKARKWTAIDEDRWDEGSVAEWYHYQLGYIKFATRLFDDNEKLLLFTEGDWDDSWIKFVAIDDDDDIPFDIPF